MAVTPALPEGFTLDSEIPPLPDGFTLDEQSQAAPSADENGGAGAVGSFPAMFVRGKTLGASDYLNALGIYTGDKLAQGLGALGMTRRNGAPITAGDLSYDDALKLVRQNAATYTANHPIASYGGQILGSITGEVPKLLSMGIGSATEPLANAIPGVLGRYLGYGLQGGGIGATAGAVGASNPQGGLPSFQDLINATRKGAKWGAGLGVAIPGALEIGGRLALKALPSSLFDKYADPTGETGAFRTFAKAAGRDEYTSPQDVAARIQQLGSEAVPADIGPNTQALGGAVAQKPGPGMTAANDVLAGRNADAASRITQGIEENVGPTQNYDALDALREARSAAAAPLREAALTAADDAAPVKSPLILRMINRPSVRSGIMHGIELVNDEVARTGEGIPIDRTWFDGQNFEDPNIKIESEPTLRILDAAKQGLGAQLEKFRDPITKQINWTVDAVNAQKNLTTFTEELKQMYPGYADYLKAWSGPTQMMDAVGQGYALARGNNPQLSQRVFGAFSPEQQEYARIGAARFYADKLGNVPFGGNASGAVGNSNYRQQILDMFAKDRGAQNNLRQLLGNEKTFNQTFQKVLGGSPTYPRAAAAQDLEGEGADIVPTVISAARGHFGDALMQLGHSILGKITGPSPAVRSQLGQMMFSQDPAVQAKLIQGIANLPAQDQARLVQYLASLRGAPSSVGGLVSASTVGGSNQ